MAELIRQVLVLVVCIWANGVLAVDPPTSLPNGGFVETTHLAQLDLTDDGIADFDYSAYAGWFGGETWFNGFGVQSSLPGRVVANRTSKLLLDPNQSIGPSNYDWDNAGTSEDPNFALLLFVLYVVPWNEGSMEVSRDVTAGKLGCILGIKVTVEDGPHFGWLRFERPDLAPGRPYRLVDYAVNPTPGSSILAGVHPPPPAIATSVRVEPGSDPVLEISWPIQLGSSAYHLEWTPSLTEPAWKPVEGVAGQSVAFSAGEGTAFFRLVRPPLP